MSVNTGALTKEDISGGKDYAAGRLSELGYRVEGLDTPRDRLWFDSLEAALTEFNLPVANLEAVRDFVSKSGFDRFFIPSRSRPYIALVPRGADAASAWVHSGRITMRRDAGGGVDEIPLPQNTVRGAGGRRQRRRAEDAPMVCSTPGCGMVLPRSGVCEYC